MRILLFLFAVLAFLAGVGILMAAKSAIHEIEAFILFLNGAVFLSGAALVEAVHLLRRDVAKLKSQASKGGERGTGEGVVS